MSTRPVTTRFFRFDAEPKKEFDPARIAGAHLRVAVLGAGNLTEEILVLEVGPFNARSPNPASRQYTMSSAAGRP